MRQGLKLFFVLLLPGTILAVAIGVYVRGIVDNPAPVVPERNLSAESAALNSAYVSYVRLGEVAKEATDQDLLTIGYKVCEMDKDPVLLESTIVNSINIVYPDAGNRILDGAKQYICDLVK